MKSSDHSAEVVLAALDDLSDPTHAAETSHYTIAGIAEDSAKIIRNLQSLLAAGSCNSKS